MVVVAAAFLSVLFAGPELKSIWAVLGGVVLWFFGWSLAALALGNREAVRRESGAVEARSWALLLVISLGIILLAASVSGTFGAYNLLILLQKTIGTLLVL